MKKTLLIAAAALAAGMLSVQAQSNVYSQNIVGYYNLIIPAGQFAFIGNQLSNGSNALNQVFKSGLVSDPDGVKNTAIWLWNGAGYATFQYWTENDAVNGSVLFASPGQGDGFYTVGGAIVNDQYMAPGQSGFLQNPGSTNITVTLVGGVVSATNIISLPGGYSSHSIPGPVSQPLVGVTNGGFVGVSDPDGVLNDAIWMWDGTGYATFQYWTENDAVNGSVLFASPGQGDGFYTVGGSITNVTPKVGQGFFIQRVAPGTGSWTNKLVIQ